MICGGNRNYEVNSSFDIIELHKFMVMLACFYSFALQSMKKPKCSEVLVQTNILNLYAN